MLVSPNKARFTGTPTKTELEQKNMERKVPFLLDVNPRTLENIKPITKLISIDRTGTSIPQNRGIKVALSKVLNKFQIM